MWKADTHPVFRHDVLVDGSIGSKPLGRLYNTDNIQRFAFWIARGRHEVEGRKFEGSRGGGESRTQGRCRVAQYRLSGWFGEERTTQLTFSRGW